MVTAVAIPADVTGNAGLADVAEQTEAALGPVDLLVNDAGVMLQHPDARHHAKRAALPSWELR
jgi:NAD(P)-dependent dehydrogenase (short-subunit alcohol dehydrogenase family)